MHPYNPIAPGPGQDGGKFTGRAVIVKCIECAGTTPRPGSSPPPTSTQDGGKVLTSNFDSYAMVISAELYKKPDQSLYSMAASVSGLT